MSNGGLFRREGVCIINAAIGDFRAARGLFGRSARRVWGVCRWGTAPHFVDYLREGYDGISGFNGRYSFLATDAEFQQLSETLLIESRKDGWSRPPFDCYHD